MTGLAIAGTLLAGAVFFMTGTGARLLGREPRRTKE
jgi:hypothetical protein